MGDKFQIKLHGYVGSVPTLNIFGYEETGAGGSCHDLSDIFDTNVVTNVALIMAGGSGFSSIEVINLDNPADFFTGVPVAGGGSVSSEILPPQDSYAYEYVRGTRASHNGQKRFAGVPEAYQSDGSVIGGYIARVQALAGYLSAALTGASAATYTPRIMRYVYPVPNPSHLPPISVVAFPISTVIYKGLSTQNTRKLNKH